MKNYTSGNYHIKHEVDIDITNVKLSSYNHINGHGPSSREIFENQKEIASVAFDFNCACRRDGLNDK